MLRVLWRAATVAAVVVAMATPRPAAAGMYINGSLNFVPVGTVTVVGGGAGLGAITSITFPALEIVNGPGGTGGTGDYLPILAGTLVGVSPLTINISSPSSNVPVITFGPPGDLSRFVYTPTSVLISSTGPNLNGASSLSYATTGTVVDTSGYFDDTPTSMSFSATQSTLTGPINVSFTLVSQVPVPVPAVLALTGLPAVALIRRYGRRLTA